jgi:hypothetical protein
MFSQNNIWGIISSSMQSISTLDKKQTYEIQRFRINNIFKFEIWNLNTFLGNTNTMAGCFFKVWNPIFSFLKSSLVNISFKVGWHRHRIITSSSQVQLQVKSAVMLHYVMCSSYRSSYGNWTILNRRNPPHCCTVDMEKVTVGNYVFWRFRVLSQFIVFVACIF